MVGLKLTLLFNISKSVALIISCSHLYWVCVIICFLYISLTPVANIFCIWGFAIHFLGTFFINEQSLQIVAMATVHANTTCDVDYTKIGFVKQNTGHCQCYVTSGQNSS